MAKRAVSLSRWHGAGKDDAAAEFPMLDIRLTELERAHGKSVIRDLLAASPQPRATGVIGIFVNATGAKRYPKAWWAELIAALKALCPCCGMVEIIPTHGKSMLDSQWSGYYSTSIRRMGAVMSGVDLMISADCGVMHLAVASKVPTVGMFSITDEAVYGPYGSRNTPLLTQGQSALETAKCIVANLPELLNPLADLPRTLMPDASIRNASDDALGNHVSAQSG